MDFRGWWSELLMSLRGTTKPSLESVSGRVMLYWNALPTSCEKNRYSVVYLEAWYRKDYPEGIFKEISYVLNSKWRVSILRVGGQNYKAESLLSSVNKTGVMVVKMYLRMKNLRCSLIWMDHKAIQFSPSKFPTVVSRNPFHTFVVTSYSTRLPFLLCLVGKFRGSWDVRKPLFLAWALLSVPSSCLFVWQYCIKQLLCFCLVGFWKYMFSS